MINSLPTFSLISNVNIWNRADGNDEEHLKGCGQNNPPFLEKIKRSLCCYLSLNAAEDCDDPGTPPGAQRSGGRFHVREKVSYLCQAGLDLLGSAERVCLENRKWSGSMPRCQGTE